MPNKKKHFADGRMRDIEERRRRAQQNTPANQNHQSENPKEYKAPNDESLETVSDQGFETRRNRSGIYVFVGLQLAAAKALTVYAIKTQEWFSAATGFANIARNGLWIGAHMMVRKAPKIATLFNHTASKTLKSVAFALHPNHDRQIHRMNALSEKILEDSLNLSHAATAGNIKAIAAAPGHSIRLLRHTFNYASLRTLEIAVKPLRHSKTGEKWLNTLKTKTRYAGLVLERNTKAREKKLTEKFSSQMYRDIVRAQINAAGALGGTLVHIPQIFSPDPLIQIGGSAATLGYLLIAGEQNTEAKRWQYYYEKAEDKEDKNVFYTLPEAHILVGYFSSKEYFKDIALKWLPAGLLVAKGSSYMLEANHIGSTPLMISGLIFTGGAAYEFIEQNGKKITHITRRLLDKIRGNAPENANDNNPATLPNNPKPAQNNQEPAP